MSVDLHSHTTASDGDLPPGELVELAAGAGVATLAVTDHDTLAGVADAVAAGARHGVEVIPGIELSVRSPHGSMHLLGYFRSDDPVPLALRLTELTAHRETRIRLIVERLNDLGLPLRFADVRALAAGQIGRPHVAAAMVDAGHVSTRDEAFECWIADGRPAHVPSQGLAPAEAVALVRESGGAPVLAHPASLALPAAHLEAFVQRLASHGLVGIEVHRPEHTPELRDTLAGIARRLRLVPSGGSDFHRPDGPVRIGDTGTPGVDADAVGLLRAAIR